MSSTSMLRRPLVWALAALAAAAAAPSPAADPPPPDDPPRAEDPAPQDDPSELERALAEELGAAEETPAPEKPAPITLVSGAGGRNYLNLSLDGLFAAGASTSRDVEDLYPGGHDPVRRGFNVQNVEVVFEGAVDPFFRGQANFVYRTDANGETTSEIEEVFATTTALPWGLQVRAGHFLTEFGRNNPTHPHTWNFVSQPLVNARMFGGDGLRNTGVRASWLMPAPFYSELLLTVQDSGGETAPGFRGVPGDEAFGRPLVALDLRSPADLLYVPRWTGSFDVGDTQTVLVGVSAAAGPNGTGPDGRTRVVGADAFWKWKPVDANRGFPFVQAQVEWMDRRYEADAGGGLPAETYRDHGGYGEVVWGILPRWLVGARYDTVGGDSGAAAADPQLVARRRIGVDVTWFPSEYSKLRLEYDRDRRDGLDGADSVWLQLEFLLGAHAAHKF